MNDINWQMIGWSALFFLLSCSDVVFFLVEASSSKKAAIPKSAAFCIFPRLMT